MIETQQNTGNRTKMYSKCSANSAANALELLELIQNKFSILVLDDVECHHVVIFICSNMS